MRTLREGLSGPDVEAWQSFLRGGDFYHGAVDGHFDAGTKEATSAFQRSAGLGPDGVAGRMTLGVALSRGFAGADWDDAGDDGPGWPPPPADLPRLSSADRTRLFGLIVAEPAPLKGNPEAIRIVNGWAGVAPCIQDIAPGVIPRSVLLHRLAHAPFLALLAAWRDEGLLDRIETWSGSWAPRFVRGSRTTLSAHAWGTAFDLNAAWNGLGVTPALRGKRGCVRDLVPAANRLGWYWGGHFSRPDGMHFELSRVSGADADTLPPPAEGS